MPNSVQEFLADATNKAAADLIAALDTLPAGKRDWKPSDKARSAIDQAAECAIINDGLADIITTRQGPAGDFMTEFFSRKASLAQDEEAARRLLETSTARVIAAIQAVSSEDFDTEILMPWKRMTLRELCAYPFWNMTYHQGQIVYIASLLGE